MKERVRGAELSYYTKQLLPFAERMRAMAQSWKEKGRELEVSTVETLEEQVSFLPHTHIHTHFAACTLSLLLNVLLTDFIPCCC